jgi:O-acetyl-ADP-ribose deacetylase (regulator of RNase III)
VKEWATEKGKLRLMEGNIAALNVDAIVNAANKSLILGGGVAGAIRTLGGPSIQEECNKIGPIKVGEAVITGGGNLKAKHVIHTAGPVYGEGEEEEKLKRATFNSLILAKQYKFNSIAFPAISTGIFRFPIQRCSEIMLDTAMDFLKDNDHPKEIVFCLYGEQALSVFENSLTALSTKKPSAFN